MYLNSKIRVTPFAKVGLTSTLDVFKFGQSSTEADRKKGLTSTLDVFKLLHNRGWLRRSSD